MGETVRLMTVKVVSDSGVIEREEVVSKIREVTEWDQQSEVFKFLGLSQ
jgi:hypothetical protein